MLENKNKMSASCDGLISRFLIAAPKPVRNELLRVIPKIQGFKIEHFLMGIHIINKNIEPENKDNITKELYNLKFSDESFNILRAKFMEYEEIARKFEIQSPFIW
jgi:hypothetical protein